MIGVRRCAASMTCWGMLLAPVLGAAEGGTNDSGTDLQAAQTATQFPTGAVPIAPQPPAADVSQPVTVNGGHDWYAHPRYSSYPATPLPMRPFVSNRIWLEAQYLLWWTRGFHIPVLVTSSPAGTPQPVAGVLGEPTTNISFGGDSVNGSERSGLRFKGGYWLSPTLTSAFQFDYFHGGNESTSFQAASNGDPILARPFLNLLTGNEDAHLIAFAPTTGSIDIRAETELQSTGALIRQTLVGAHYSGTYVPPPHDFWLDFLLGYRYYRLKDELRMNETLVTLGPTNFDLAEQFDTRNSFHGVDVGFAAQFRRNRLTLDLLIKLGLGNSAAKANINGTTTTTVAPAPATTDVGALLAQTTNIGAYEDSDFATVSELGLVLGYDITNRLRATFGYTLIYWSRVARPGDQIDRVLNPSYFPGGGPPTGAPRPEFTFVTTDFWAQGLDFGLLYRF